MKPGMKLKSQVCDTEVIVIRCGSGVLECGGFPMDEQKPASVGTPAEGKAGGTVTGKRYVDAGGAFEALCVKPGKGSLSVDGVLLTVKQTKPLPASD